MNCKTLIETLMKGDGVQVLLCKFCLFRKHIQNFPTIPILLRAKAKVDTKAYRGWDHLVPAACEAPSPSIIPLTHLTSSTHGLLFLEYTQQPCPGPSSHPLPGMLFVELFPWVSPCSWSLCSDHWRLLGPALPWQRDPSPRPQSVFLKMHHHTTSNVISHSLCFSFMISLLYI